ncbi:hypothetical protein ALC53_12146 [Atta colombica]|uniref:Uncharacterized protein n=1 Tax=Atta colombica TaxID=520822 RepID=A0A151HZA4_9HYME|nr:hypothetical protein ALC53_12146 [Atta colombica]
MVMKSAQSSQTVPDRCDKRGRSANQSAGDRRDGSKGYTFPDPPIQRDQRRRAKEALPFTSASANKCCRQVNEPAAEDREIWRECAPTRVWWKRKTGGWTLRGKRQRQRRRTSHEVEEETRDGG